MKRVVALHLQPSSELLARLRYGWGNEGFSASEDFVRGCIREALICPGPILECGTGLTTLIMGVIGDHRGLKVVSLEHSSEWCKRVRSIAASLGIRSVAIEHRPLQDYGDFSWYGFPQSTSEAFSLVICDGPPGDTFGGRYGLLPIAGSALNGHCVILLDDADRPSEQAIARRWQEEGSLKCEIAGEQGRYLRLTLPGIP